MKYELGGIGFTSKDAIKKHVQDIFKSYKVGDRLSAKDFGFVRDLIDWHPAASQKIGSGIEFISIHIPKPWTTKGFLINRTDGSTTDISYKVCLNPKMADQYSKIREACRGAIVPQVSEFKKTAFFGRDLVRCEVTNQMITWDDAHVDHYPKPFIDLVQDWLNNTGIDPNAIALSGSADNETRTRFIDPRLERDWAMYHKSHAQLRIVKASENCRLGAHRKAS